MIPDFCALILTHGRPDQQVTVASLARHGYTGPWFLVVDDQDPTLPEYLDRYGDRVVVFSKDQVGAEFDEGDNFNARPHARGVIVYARNAAHKIAASLGFRWFIQLDDDYHRFRYLFTDELESREARMFNLDRVWAALLDFYRGTPPAVVTVAMGQGGDYLGGRVSTTVGRVWLGRKAMNTFLCDVQRPFQFPGRINEDVNAYTQLQRAGAVFLTVYQVGIDQKVTQTQAGGMTGVYLDTGTYVKSFYTVMRCPSAVTVSTMPGRTDPRIHHSVNWRHVAPRFVSEAHRKPRALT